MSPELTVWYDGECPLCRREIALMRSLDKGGAIHFVEARSADSCPVDTTLLLQRFHAQERGAEIVSGAAAFAAMWRAIPLLRPLGLLARRPSCLRILEWSYAGFLRIRPWLQRRVSRATND